MGGGNSRELAGQFIFSTWARAQARKPGGRVGPEFSSLTIVMGYYKSIKKE